MADVKRALFVPGMPKSGTTFLVYSLLGRGVISPYSGSRPEKEISLFHQQSGLTNRARFLDSFAPDDEHQWLCDGTPQYIFDPISLDRIVDSCAGDEIRFVICLRERVQQVFSWYIHFCIHQLVNGIWFQSGFKQNPAPELYNPDGIFDFLYKPISPFVRKALDMFGRESITVFNHHTDYSESAPFWGQLSESLGYDCSPTSRIRWHQNYFPELLYFDRPGRKIVQGREYQFQPGNLVLVAGRFSKVFRDVEYEHGMSAASSFATAVNSLDEAGIDYIRSQVYSDFEEALSLLGLSISDFPEPKPTQTYRPLLDPADLTELQSTDLRKLGAARSTETQTEGLLERPISIRQSETNELRALLLEAERGLEHARRYPWKYVRGAIASRFQQ
ncbi:hypothetical protein [uncultured Ruegeria sp.]|uniref:hypothetical protein n=1 Tax=uncultured Ruegeria sp. TaxID=259304 RepID=UPI0026333E5D|nr:hypothetical protein [uncultured Ruegeria sp.]